jgi:hypothetical protein
VSSPLLALPPNPFHFSFMIIELKEAHDKLLKEISHAIDNYMNEVERIKERLKEYKKQVSPKK